VTGYAEVTEFLSACRPAAQRRGDSGFVGAIAIYRQPSVKTVNAEPLGAGLCISSKRMMRH